MPDSPLPPIDSQAPGPEALETARAALMAGGCIGFPTDTVYGLAARLDDAAAVANLFELKGRAATNPMAVLVDGVETALALGRFDPMATALAERYWPGPLTLVVRRIGGLGIDLGGDAATIGLRCPGLDLVRTLAAAVGPLVTTSANRSGEPTLDTATEIELAFGDGVACVVDGGRLSAAASTVVDLTGPELVILREGPITAADLETVVSPLRRSDPSR